MSTSGGSVTDWERREQSDRRAHYVASCEAIRQVWDRRIGSRRGPLPGATLDPVVTPLGWCGHVQGFITQTDQMSRGGEGRKALQHAVEEAYGLPAGAVLIDDGWRRIGDTRFIWAYERPGVVDYHERQPYSVWGLPSRQEPGPGGVTGYEWSELQDWAVKHRRMLEALRAGHPVDMEQVSRRYNRMRAAILDALTRAGADDVRAVLIERGLGYGDVGEDIAERLGIDRASRWGGAS